MSSFTEGIKIKGKEDYNGSKTKVTIVASVIKPKQITTQNVPNTPAEEVILRRVELTLASTFRTFEWAKPYEPVELTFNTMQQILYPNFQ